MNQALKEDDQSNLLLCRLLTAEAVVSALPEEQVELEELISFQAVVAEISSSRSAENAV